MLYKDKYLKYKFKYIELKTTFDQTGGANDTMNFKKGIETYKNVILLSEKLEQVYDSFWTNIHYNDAYIFYKNAIDYYKNVQNNKFHSFFSSIINKKLYTGTCQYIENNDRKDFKNNDNISKIDLDDLCNLSVQVINILDTVFTVSPQIPFNLTVYRFENRKITDEIYKLKKGDYYRNLGYMSTTINPWLYYHKVGDYYVKDNEKKVIMTIQLPEKSYGYYMNSPFGIELDKNLNKYTGFQEYEILLPRDNIFEIIETKEINNCLFIQMILRNQLITKTDVITNKKTKILPDIFTKKEYEDIIKKTDYIKLELKKKIEDTNKIDIYLEYQKIHKNKKKLEYIDFIWEKIISIKLKYLLEWINKKPLYNAKKYPNIKEKDFEKTYNKFIELIQNEKKTTGVYLNCSIIFKNDNYLYKELSNQDILGKTIKIKTPIVFDKTLTSSLISETSNFICYTDGKNENKLSNYYKIDNNNPHMILVKYNKPISYIPLLSGSGITFSIQQLKIKKVNKIYITDNVFYYIIDAI